MKKTLSIILSAIIILSVLSVNAFATDTITETLLNKVDSVDEISVKLTTGDTVFGTSTATYIIKGNTVAYDYNTGFLNLRVVIKDGTAYAYLPSLPFFYVKVDGTGLANVDVKSLIKTATGITRGVTHYESGFNETIDGTTYYVEQFNDGAQVKLKFYYTGDQLKLLNVKDEKTKSEQNTYFENISFSVDDSIVAVPTGIDLTPILKTLFVSLISSAVL